MGNKIMINPFSYQLTAALEKVKELGYKVVFMGLHGSQNYNLDTEASDFDWYVAVEPSFHSFVFGEPMASQEVEYEYGILTIKDVRGMFQMIKKGSFNFLELLFTRYYYVEEKYMDDWNDLHSEAENIARSNPYATIRSYIGVAGNTLQKEMNGKKCAQILTFANQITSYINGDKFEDVLESEELFNRDFILKVKTPSTGEYFNILARAQFDYIQNFGTSYLRDKNAEEMQDNVTRDKLDQILMNICKKKDW